MITDRASTAAKTAAAFLGLPLGHDTATRSIKPASWWVLSPLGVNIVEILKSRALSPFPKLTQILRGN